MAIPSYNTEDVLFQERKEEVQGERLLLIFLSGCIGCILTFQFQLLRQTPVASSAIATCVVWLFMLFLNKDKRYLISSVYCGSFAGMSALFYGDIFFASIYTFYIKIFAFSIATSLCYVVLHLLSARFPRATLMGYGGRLGAMAFFSSYLCSLALSGTSLGAESAQLINPAEASQGCIFYAIIACAGAVTPYLLLKIKNYEADFYFLTGLTAFMSLIGSVLFSIFFEGLNLAPAALYTGLFVGMTRSHLCSPRGLAAAGALSGVMMVYTTHRFEGIGGSLGLTAMLSVLCVAAFLYVVKYLAKFLWFSLAPLSAIAASVAACCFAFQFSAVSTSSIATLNLFTPGAVASNAVPSEAQAPRLERVSVSAANTPTPSTIASSAAEPDAAAPGAVASNEPEPSAATPTTVALNAPEPNDAMLGTISLSTAEPDDATPTTAASSMPETSAATPSTVALNAPEPIAARPGAVASSTPETSAATPSTVALNAPEPIAARPSAVALSAPDTSAEMPSAVASITPETSAEMPTTTAASASGWKTETSKLVVASHKKTGQKARHEHRPAQAPKGPLSFLFF